MRKKIIGRSQAIETLKTVEQSKESVMLGVYGRRRIGKTFLVDEYFKDEKDFFYIKTVGIKGEETEGQIASFVSLVNESVDRFNREIRAIVEGNGEKYSEALKQKLEGSTWEDYFGFLARTIDIFYSVLKDNGIDRRIVYFFDEVPYAAEQTENFANRLGAIWESRLKNFDRFIFVLCGSAASWMITEIANATGGLNSRCRHKIPLKPFSYREMIEYFDKKHDYSFSSDIDSVKTFISIGGVAKYLDFYADKSGLMFSQSISDLMFGEFREMRDEFDLLMESIFKNANVHKKIIEYLSGREKGASENDIITELKEVEKSEPEIKRCVKELVDCDYLLEMPLIRNKGEEQVFRLIDEYCRFYFKWIHNVGEENFHSESSYWNNSAHSSKIWFGTSFEVFCFRNRSEILSLLSLERFNTKFYSFGINEDGGAEGDVVIEASIDKKVHGVFIIENKFKEGTKFSINAGELKVLLNKITTLQKRKKYTVTPQIIFITSDGVVQNANFKKLKSKSFTIADF